MVGLVVVSHSATLAAGVVELARQMAGDGVAIEPAGGMADPEGGIGTDVALVAAAIARAAGPDGVLVLMDLGSALMSAEMAVELTDGTVRVELSEAPLVEGAVAAAALAGAGASLDEVAAEARTALTAKTTQLAPAAAAPAPAGGPAGPSPPAPAPTGGDAAPAPVPTARLPVAIPLGLHARPAARVVETVGRFAADVTLADETSGRGPVDARSLSALLTLGARHGHTLLARATGPDAPAALAALTALAAEGYGDEPVAAPPAPLAPPAAAAPSPPPSPGTTLRGLAVAGGVAIGAVRFLAAPQAATTAGPAGDPAEEGRRLEAAVVRARADVEAARERVPAGERGIFDAHLLLLADTVLLTRAREAIADGTAAAAAWDSAVRAVADDLRAVDDPYLRERAADLDDVGARVLGHLTGAPAAAAPAERGVLAAADLTPGQVAALDPTVTVGIALARGGATSHAAILARALGIPAAAGLGAALLAVPAGTTVVVDGTKGTVEVEPDPATLAAHEHARLAAAERRERARAHAHAPATTTDGTTIEVAANLGSAREAAEAVRLGADGVGLLRTEFLFLDREAAPTEAEQHSVLDEIATALQGRPLIVRTLDAGADKPLPYLRQPPEANPYLGVRGLRLGLARPELLRTQLRAILRAAHDHPLQIMFPMVATLAELREASAMVEEIRAELRAPEVPVGVMVEVPALALQAERFAAEADFLSVGTNDLTQYTMAAERGNDAVGALLAGPQPPVLRLIQAVTDAAAAHGRWVGVCGELAGDPAAAVLLAGLGVQELSVSPPLVPDVKDALRHTSLAEARDLAGRALDLDDAAAVADLLGAVTA